METPPQVNQQTPPKKTPPAEISANPEKTRKSQKPEPSRARQKIGDSEALDLIREAGALALQDREIMTELLGRHYQQDALVCIYDVRILLPDQEPHDLKGFFTIGDIQSAYLAAEALPTLEQHLVSGILKPSLSLVQRRFVEEDIPRAGDSERPTDRVLSLPDIRVRDEEKPEAQKPDGE